jgi:heme/copper-type cytochrome/quinol oxidase subunit 2
MLSTKRLLYLALICVLAVSSTVAVGIPITHASSSAQIRDIYLVVEPDLGGHGYDKFYPQNIVVMQGDQANITVRNLDSEGFALTIENYTEATIQPGITSGTETEPVDTHIPMLNATMPGIFEFSAAGHPEMNGYFIVLPAEWSQYDPAPQNRVFSVLSVPDFAGDGYDKFLPGNMVVNQGDNVSVIVRNTDDMPHGFAIAAFGIDQAVQPAQDAANGTILPVETKIQTFTATTAGTYEYLCTVPCGPGHIEMVGTLVVLPRKGASYDPQSTTAYRYLTIKADYAGDGYDKFVPGVMFANQGDLVYIKVRNTDDMYHGFALLAYNINNVTVDPAVDTVNGTIPTDTYIPNFIADKLGIFVFFCTIYCGPGHYQMIGYLVVLPKSTPTAASSGVTGVMGGISPSLAIVVAVAVLLVGFVLGSVVRWNPKKR